MSQAITMYPNFEGTKPMVEQIGVLENLVRDYEMSAGPPRLSFRVLGVAPSPKPETPTLNPKPTP